MFRGRTAPVRSSEPNGDTLLLASSAMAHPDNAAAAASLRPVVLTSTAPMVLVVRASLPAHDPREFAAYLAAQAGASYGSSGVGNPTHLAAARLVEHLRADAVHVPYGGSALAFFVMSVVCCAASCHVSPVSTQARIT